MSAYKDPWTSIEDTKGYSHSFIRVDTTIWFLGSFRKDWMRIYTAREGKKFTIDRRIYSGPLNEDPINDYTAVMVERMPLEWMPTLINHMHQDLRNIALKRLSEGK
jgi:hypothetical protein